MAVNIPNTIYNIAPGNNLVTFVRLGTTYTATIPNGAYTSATLPPAIAAAMCLADSGAAYYCTYNQTTFKLTIFATAAFQLSWSQGPWYECGFLNQTTAIATSHTGTNSIQLGLPFSIYLEIPQLSQGMSSTRSNDSCTFVVPMSVDAGCMQYYSNNGSYEQVYTYSAGLHLHDINIRVRTRSGQTLDLCGNDWQMHLALE